MFYSNVKSANSTNLNLLIGFIATILFFSYSLFSFHRETKNLVLYYSAECPHCIEVIKFINSSCITRPVILKEVYYDEKNYEEFEQVARKFGVKLISVPSLFDPQKGRLITGEDRVLEYISRFTKKP